MRIELGQAIGRVLGRRERISYAPPELSEEAREVWIKCNDWSNRIFEKFGLDKFPETSADRMYMKGMLRIGFAQAAFENGYHDADDKKEARYGVGEGLTHNVFSEVNGWFKAQKSKLSDSFMNLMGARGNPVASANIIVLQEEIYREANEIFQKFYGCWQLRMYSPEAVRQQVGNSLREISLRILQVRSNFSLQFPIAY